jgi:hypothetical protein
MIKVPAPASAELIAVAPRRHLGPKRGPDAHELESLANSR